MASQGKSVFGMRRSNQDDRNSDQASHGAVVSRKRRSAFGAAAVLTVVAAILVWWLLVRGPIEPVGLPSDTQSIWKEIAEELPLDPGRRYSDKELGLYGLIDGVIDESPFYIRFRTVEEYFASEDDEWERIYTSGAGHERDRWTFENMIEDAIRTAYIFLPADLGAGGRLELAFVEAMRECASEAGFPEINPVGGTDEELAYWEAEFGLTLDGLLDLRHECAQQAARYPTLDPEVRDEMLNRIRKHYLEAVHDYIRDGHDYMRDGDIVEIPVEQSKR